MMRLRSVTRETLRRRVSRRLGWAIRDRWPDRQVERTVQGVTLLLPWAHRLPDFARYCPEYGQNLVHLATLLADDKAPLTFLDVGANIGDSTLQILEVADARALCVEADFSYVNYLRRNVGRDPRATIEAALLSASELDVDMAPIRGGGTARFEPGTSHLTAALLSIDALRERHPAFHDLCLVKSDTDGYDVELVPAIARAWISAHPVLFFEYDHRLSRIAGNDPLSVWPNLSDLGYESVAVWDNEARPLGRIDISEIAVLAASRLDDPVAARAGSYWDVAVVHSDDAAGLAAITQLVPRQLA